MATERIDALAFEPQFVDHCAPVWRALPSEVRGRFLTDPTLEARATARGLRVEAIDVAGIRRQSLPPTAARGDGPAAFVVSIGDMKVARRLGYRRFVFMEHGAGQSYLGGHGGGLRHPSYAGGADRGDVELFLVPNDYAAATWRDAYPEAGVAIVGCPKLDELPRREAGPGPVVAIAFHWPAFVAPEAGTALGHYFGALKPLAAAFPGRVIGHAHPKSDWPARMARYYRRAGIEFVPDFDEVCRRADVYVCENSSTIFEFASTGRPVVLLNAPMYRRNVNHGLRFEPSAGCPLQAGRHFCGASHVGIQVDDPTELVASISDALADPPARQAAREAALNLVYQPRTNGAGYAAAAILDWLGTRAMVAA